MGDGVPERGADASTGSKIATAPFTEPRRAEIRRNRQARRRHVEELFSASASELIRYLAYRLPRGAETEDLAQEVYLRMLRLDASREIRNPRAYVFRVADAVRRDWRRRRDARPPARHQPSSPPNDVVEQRADPLDEALWRQRFNLIKESIRDLPPRCRQALVLHRIHGWTYSEIAAELGVSSSMVKKYLATALLHCRQALSD